MPRSRVAGTIGREPMTSLLRRRARTDNADGTVIRMVDVGMTYPNGKVALADVTVSIPRGDFVFLVGPSGAGKSTFIRLLIREQLPTSGEVSVAGRDLLTMRRGHVPALRRRIGTVFQDFRLLPAKTVWENVAFALRGDGRPVIADPTPSAAAAQPGRAPGPRPAPPDPALRRRAAAHRDRPCTRP